MDVNVAGLFAGCRAAAREMMRGGRGGAIVNVASNAGKVGYPNMVVYNASKAAVISLTRSLAAEWAAHGINVNAVCPGGVDTPMLMGVAEWLAPRLGLTATALHAEMKPKQMARHVQPIEVGRVVAFLLSDRARIIRGQAVNVDGETPPTDRPDKEDWARPRRFRRDAPSVNSDLRAGEIPRAPYSMGGGLSLSKETRRWVDSSSEPRTTSRCPCASTRPRTTPGRSCS